MAEKSELCYICGQDIEDTENHLRAEHDDQIEKIRSEYSDQMAERINTKTASAPAEAQEGENKASIVTKRHKGELCPFCGEAITNVSDGFDIEKIEMHLQDHVDEEGLSTEMKETLEKTYGTSLVDSLVEASDTEGSDQTTEETGNLRKPDILEDAKESDTSVSDQGRQKSSVGVDSDEISEAGKFSIFGIGGAGNRILDSFLMRRDTLQKQDHPIGDAWDGGIQVYQALNTNDGELTGTYYQREDQSLEDYELFESCLIGDGRPAGENPRRGKQLLEKYVDEGKPIDTYRFGPEDILTSQGVMFVHSVVKGTGSGGTPVFAQYIKDDVLNQGDKDLPIPLISAVVLPKEEEVRYNPDRTVNAGYGIGTLSEVVDLIIPFDNSRLEDVSDEISPQIDDIKTYNKTYHRENRPLTQFIEALMLTSNPEMINEHSSDDGFDPRDMIGPVEDRYPLNPEQGFQPAIIAAPLIAVSNATSVEKKDLKILINDAFEHGLLVDCDVTTVWGGAFVFFGPEDVMEDVKHLISNVVPHKIIDERFEDDSPRIGIHQAHIPSVDKLYMVGVLWNPRMPKLEAMFEKAKEEKDKNSKRGELIENNWDKIQAVYSYLGRENRE